MTKRSTLQQYCLKAPRELFNQIDKNRMLLAGVSNASGTTRADYIRDAIEHYSCRHLTGVSHSYYQTKSMSCFSARA